MIFKGHFDPLLAPLDFNKLTIFTKSDEQKDIRKEYFYKDNKVSKIIDYRNSIISEYEHSDDNFVVKFYLFEDTIDKREFDSIKKFTYSNSKKTREVLINIENEKEIKIYTGEFEYLGDDLSFERYTYNDGEEYRIKHEWNKAKSINNIIHLDEPDKVKYTLNENGYLIESLHFKYEGSVKKTIYEYKDNKLFKLIEYPHLEYKKTLLGKIKITGEAQFMDETESYYFENGLLKEEVVKDFETKEIVNVLYYYYE
ncbi:hypothetical protein [uncultured Lacinutrix sp.]|uniref:hypothetical protein n=1 Tax=uncultured Lacinutrix sp. TaxID=574032 RepID=UPI00260B3242|nr:hypothetical protein [uncultured Lacinutrix sp.]